MTVLYKIAQKSVYASSSSSYRLHVSEFDMAEIGYMLSETFTINAVRDGNEMKLVMKEYTFNQAIELPQSCWREFASLICGIHQAIESVQNGNTVYYRKSFGEGYYANVSSETGVDLESPDGKIGLGISYWNKIMSYLPELTSAIPDLLPIEHHLDEVELLREQLKTEKDRRRELEQELSLTKQQVFYINNLYFQLFISILIIIIIIIIFFVYFSFRDTQVEIWKIL